MIIRLLGIMDLLAGIILYLLQFEIGTNLGIFFAFYLMIKGVVFITNLVSMMDIIGGVMMLLATQGHYFFFTWIFVLWLLQKGLFSFFQ